MHLCTHIVKPTCGQGSVLTAQRRHGADRSSCRARRGVTVVRAEGCLLGSLGKTRSWLAARCCCWWWGCCKCGGGERSWRRIIFRRRRRCSWGGGLGWQWPRPAPPVSSSGGGFSSRAAAAGGGEKYRFAVGNGKPCAAGASLAP